MSIKMYKLVSQDMTTHGGMKWEIGKTNVATGRGNEICTNGVLHCYATPEQAILFNPLHANIQNPILLEIECSEIVANDKLKYACKQQTPIRKIYRPEFTTTQRVAFAIKCALLVHKAADFVEWAEAWLSGEDRSARSAAWSAESAARSAARSARSAELAARSAESAELAARSAESAELAARSAARSAVESINFQEIIEWVLENIK